MNVYQGKSVFGGIAIGHLCVYKKGEQQVTRQKIADVEAEVKRFQDAKEAAQAQLGELYDKAVREVGEANAAIFEMHQMLLEDEDYQDSVENIIRTQQVNAEYATAITSDHFSSMFAEMDDDYMKERAADIRDISERVIANLNGENKSKVVTDEPVIILADDLAPSETVQLEKDKVLSFVTVHGSVNSHTAILARTMGIPALVSTEMELTDDLDGKLAVVDGNHGVNLCGAGRRDHGKNGSTEKRGRGEERTSSDFQKQRKYYIGWKESIDLCQHRKCQRSGTGSSEWSRGYRTFPKRILIFGIRDLSNRG